MNGEWNGRQWTSIQKQENIVCICLCVKTRCMNDYELKMTTILKDEGEHSKFKFEKIKSWQRIWIIVVSYILSILINIYCTQV